MRISLAFAACCLVSTPLVAASPGDSGSTYPAPSDGIHTSPLLTTEQIVKAWQPTARSYRELTPWAPGGAEFKLVNAGTKEAYAEINAHKSAVVGLLKFSTPIPLADSVVDFEYRVPPGIAGHELNVNLRVPGDTKLRTMRLPVKIDQWQRETIPLASIIGGDRWRLSSVRLASSVEVGLLVPKNSAAVADIQFRHFTVSRTPSPWGPLPVPKVLSATAAGVSRTFVIKGEPLQAWVQVVAANPVEVILNGHNLGQASLKNVDTQKWPLTPIPIAREFPLDGLLVQGANTLVLKPLDDTATGLVCALGWVNGPDRKVLISDSTWTSADHTPITVTPLADWGLITATSKGRVLDIYPLREAKAWRSSQQANPPALRTATLANTRPAITGPAGPWKIAEDTHGRWRLVTPQGTPLYFLGTQVLGLFPDINYRYYRTMLETYASEDDFIADTLNQVGKLGFNGIAPAVTTGDFFRAGRRAGFYNFQFLGPAAGGPFMKNYAGHEISWSDPFDPAWREHYRARAKRFADAWRDDPSMIGVYVNNEMPLSRFAIAKNGGVIGYVYSDACRKAFAQWLAEHYDHDFSKLKAAWSPELPAIAKIKDFADVTTLDLSPPLKTCLPGRPKSPVQTDLYAFAAHAMSVYADFMLGVLHEELPGKLIASNRFAGTATDDMIAAWKNYDLIAWNVYSFGRWGHATYTPELLDYIQRAHRITGKPMIISETGLVALDARLPDHSAQFYTQKQRGEGYAELLRQVHDELPFIVGFTLFGWQNLSDTEHMSWGVVDDHGHPYADYAAGVEKANKALLSSESSRP